MSPDEWLRLMSINLNGVFWCSRCSGRHMVERGSGVIVNIASMSGPVVNWPQPQAAYNVSKAGVIHLTKSLASEWAASGVRVNSVSPGYIGTEMTKLGMATPGWGEPWLARTPHGPSRRARRRGSGSPVPRFGRSCLRHRDRPDRRRRVCQLVI
jgi:NAD(P)-dependent dehydrogenase (short-subunit alcohol dehydrogenase family)